MKNTSLIASCLALSALVGCASGPSSKPITIKVGEVSPNFDLCAVQSYKPWLVAVVLESESSNKPMKTLVAEFVGPSQEAQNRALGYLNDLKSKKYPSAEHMAAAQFNTCLAQKPKEVFFPERTQSCYREQRILFDLQVMRFEAGVTQQQAADHLIKENRSADGSSERMIQRLARDTYTILKPGGESAFSSAQFNVCMTKP